MGLESNVGHPKLRSMLERLESFYLPKDLLAIRQRNLNLWSLKEKQFDDEQSKWTSEINTDIKKLCATESPHISIIIPAHNEEKYILQILQSIAKQKYDKGIEVIVVDNNSSGNDRTSKFAELCGVKVIRYDLAKNSKNFSPIAYARQVGLEAALGDIVLTTDADAIVPNTWVQTISAPLDKNPKISCVTGSVVHYDRHEKLVLFPADNFSPLLRKYLTIYQNLRGHHVPEKTLGSTAGSNTAFRRQQGLDVGGYDLNPRIGEDTNLGLKLQRFGKIKYLSEMPAKVRVSPRRYMDINIRKMPKTLKGYEETYLTKDGDFINKR